MTITTEEVHSAIKQVSEKRSLETSQQEAEKWDARNFARFGKRL
jgi:hypothetical protein